MRILLALIVGVVLGAVGVWYLDSTKGPPNTAQGAAARIENGARNTGQSLQEKLRVLDLHPQQIKDELARTGQVVRRKAQEAGHAVADATADARITAAVKTKFLTSHDLSALSISVNTTNGIVTLSGTVPSVDAISQAMLLAMEIEGVQEVISTLQVKPPARTG